MNIVRTRVSLCVVEDRHRVTTYQHTYKYTYFSVILSHSLSPVVLSLSLLSPSFSLLSLPCRYCAYLNNGGMFLFALAMVHALPEALNFKAAVARMELPTLPSVARGGPRVAVGLPHAHRRGVVGGLVEGVPRSTGAVADRDLQVCARDACVRGVCGRRARDERGETMNVNGMEEGQRGGDD